MHISRSGGLLPLLDDKNQDNVVKYYTIYLTNSKKHLQ